MCCRLLGVLLVAFAAVVGYAVTGCRVGLSLPSLSLAAAVVRLARLCAAAQHGKLLAALAAIIRYDVVGCRFVLAVALIGCRRCSLRLRAVALLLLLLSAMLSSAVAWASPLLSLAVTFARLTCVPPLYVACRSLLSLRSSVCCRSHWLSPMLTSPVCVPARFVACRLLRVVRGGAPLSDGALTHVEG